VQSNMPSLLRRGT